MFVMQRSYKADDLFRITWTNWSTNIIDCFLDRQSTYRVLTYFVFTRKKHLWTLEEGKNKCFQNKLQQANWYYKMLAKKKKMKVKRL